MSHFLTLEAYRLMQSGVTPDGASDRVSALYRAAAEGGAIGEGDALLIGDLQALSGCTGLDDESLPLHALMILMFDALGDGSLCLDLNAERLIERSRTLGVGIENIGAEILAKIPQWPALIGRIGEFKPLILREGERLLYFQRWHDCERRLEVQLTRLLKATPADLPDEKTLKSVFNDVLEKNPVGGSKAPLKLEELQRAALGFALLNEFSIISGGPGTGKTTLVATLLRCLVRLGIPPTAIRLAAPTGRAAARMTESIRRAAGSVATRNAQDSALLNLEAQTLHRLLVYRPSRNDFQFGPDNPLEGRVLIVDEVSMVDAAMMARVLEAAPPGMRVILVGDREQLPSVEAGAVLDDLLPATFANGATAAMSARIKKILGVSVPVVAKPLAVHDRAVILTAHRRVAKALQPIVATVRAGRSAPLFANDGESYRWVDTQALGREGWRGVLQEWRKRHWNSEFIAALRESRAALDFENGETLQAEPFRVLLAGLFERLQRAQILTAARAGPFGCERINDVFSDALQTELDPRGPRTYFAGLPILVTRNNYAQRLFNGDIGLVLADRFGRYRAVFPQTIVEPDALPQRGFIALSLDALGGGWDAAFAMTIHKSQGSEYDEVLLVVPPLKDADSGDHAPRMQRLLSREILYTGITRARNAVKLCGSREAIELALSRHVRRVSGLTLPKPVPIETDFAAPEPGMLF